ncbi:MAG: 50S ribosomal protein L24 [Myxococcales bacterium]|nr:MAG: 50S ribosomal protein L24 [Myxococcales bacterium]
MPRTLHVKKGDTVVVISGKEKGSKGKVIYTKPERNRVAVERLNMVKRHRRPSQKFPTGGIVEKEQPFDASNVTLVCPKCSEAIRAKRHVLDTGKTMRRCPGCGEDFE